MAIKPIKPSKQARNNRKQQLKKALAEQARPQEQPQGRQESPVFKPLG